MRLAEIKGGRRVCGLAIIEQWRTEVQSKRKKNIYIEREREGNVSAVTLVGYLEERESGPHLEKKRWHGEGIINTCFIIFIIIF